jgi:hypothetical protein
VLLEAGEIASPYWFADAGGGAFEVGLFGGYAMSEHVTGLLGVDYTAYSLSFDPPPPERAVVGGPIADGASDTYLNIWLGGEFSVPSL